MNQDPLRLSAVESRQAQHLRLTFQDGQTFEVDLTEWIANTRALRALSDPALFEQARLGEWGTSVVWMEDELDLGADNLRHLAVEQAGGIGHERLVIWMHEAGLTQERAADAIGVSRRMLNYYLRGAKPIPKTVWLACLGWKAQQRRSPAKRLSADPAMAVTGPR